MSISEENTRIQVTLPKELKTELEKKAQADNRSVSNYVVKLIHNDITDDNRVSEHLQTRKDSNHAKRKTTKTS